MLVFVFVLISVCITAMDDDVQSMIGVADLVCMLLYGSISRSDFHRGPCAADGTLFFIGGDVVT